jgi:hypothetical protein
MKGELDSALQQLCWRIDWFALGELQHLLEIKHHFPWHNRTEWGIDDSAWKRALAAGMEPLPVFCHPRVAEEQPRLMAYYRSLTFASRSGLAGLVGDTTDRLEQTTDEYLSRAALMRVVVAVNTLICGLINLQDFLSVECLPWFRYQTFGNIARGRRTSSLLCAGQSAVRAILVNHLRNQIVRLVRRDHWSFDYSAEVHAQVIDEIAEIRVVRLRSGHHLLFSSEPDVSLRDPTDLPLLAIEVKAGFDTAAALERLGAGMKSFDNDRDLNPRLKTVYVVRCMTPELRKRLTESRHFDHIFGLAELLADDRTQRKFANLIVRTVIGRAGR